MQFSEPEQEKTEKDSVSSEKQEDHDFSEPDHHPMFSELNELKEEDKQTPIKEKKASNSAAKSNSLLKEITNNPMTSHKKSLISQLPSNHYHHFIS
jgi:hypothetical protein